MSMQIASARLADDVARATAAASEAAARHTPGSFEGNTAQRDTFRWLLGEAGHARNLDALASAQHGLPPLADDGFLPAGIWQASFGEFASRFGSASPERADLVDKLRSALPLLRNAGAHDVVVGGSMVSAKAAPHDVDLVFVAAHADVERVKGSLAGWNMAHSFGRKTIDLFDADGVILEPKLNRAHAEMGETMLEFYGHTDRGTARGVVKISLDSFDG